MKIARIARIVRKEIIQVRRDRRMMAIIIIAPILQLLLFGYAVTTDVNHISTAVLDEDGTRMSRAFIDELRGCRYFDINYMLRHPSEIDALMDEGRAQLVVRITRGFARDIARGRSGEVQTVLDASDSMTAGIIAGYVNEVVRKFAQSVIIERLDRMKAQTARMPSVDGRIRIWYNPELKSVNFMVPGVLCLILLFATMIMTSLAIVKEKEIGTLEQIVVTPITPGELMIGKTIPFLAIGFIDTALVLSVAALWFKVRIAGSVPLLFLFTVFFLLTTLGLGIFISTVSKTQQEATMTSFFFLLPSILLSGFMFPIENMPKAVQYLTYAIPMRYFLEIVRGVFLKGLGMEYLWPQALILALVGTGIITLSALRFSKRLG
jgi:ABC-2 type transport system permease protein